jgi:hypothetical protein
MKGCGVYYSHVPLWEAKCVRNVSALSQATDIIAVACLQEGMQRARISGDEENKNACLA